MLIKSLRIRKNSAYQNIFAEGVSFPGKHVVAYGIKGQMKFGFIASKKIGNAVQRNRAKRLMREVIRLHLSEIPKDLQIIFIARKSIQGLSYKEVEKSMLQLLFKIKNKV